MTEQVNNIEKTPPAEKREVVTLLAAIFIIGACGLIYELLIGSLSAYLEGDSITHFSIVIGFFMFAMGIGSWFSRFFTDDDLIYYFIFIELILGILGGLSGFILFTAYAVIDQYMQVMIFVTISIGILVGLELPLLTRILKKYGTLALTLSNVLSFDYIGALVAALFFPFFFMPHFGAVKTGVMFGMLNIFVAMATIYVFATYLTKKKKAGLNFLCIVAMFAFLILFGVSESIVSSLEASLYNEEIVLVKQTKYQKIIVTKWKNIMRLFMDGNLQFSSTDEYRYHEALVHPPMLVAKRRENILILGGGDGLAAREVLKYKEVKSLYVVDIDPAITDIALNNHDFKIMNENSFHDKRVKILNMDARKFLSEWKGESFDVIIVDFPDPNNESLSKLYTTEFYREVKQRLSTLGAVSIQSTSPFYSPQSFYMINRTLEQTGFDVHPYHVYVPSFGEWGFNLCIKENIFPEKFTLEKDFKYRFLNAKTINAIFDFPEDMKEVGEGTNSFYKGSLLKVYNAEWKKWN